MTKTKKSGLGRGLGAFFGDEVISEQQNRPNEADKETEKDKVSRRRSSTAVKEVKSEEEKPEGKETLLKLSLIEPNKEQPRKLFNEELLKELSDSIKKYGLLQPLLVQKKGDYYEIIAGERRWRAAKMAGLKEVPVVIRDYTKQQTMEIALIENVQREDLNPIEEAQAYQQLMQEFGLKQEDIASRVSKNRATITNSMRLLKLDPRVQDLLIQDQLSSGHARAILGIEDKEQQFLMAQRVINEKLSVREIEKAVKALTKPAKDKQELQPEDKNVELVFQNLENRMKSIMGTKVSINKKDKNKGRIEIEYYSSAELERLVDLIESIR